MADRGGLKAQSAAFEAGDEEDLRTARATLSRQCSRRITHRFRDSRDTQSLWRGIQTITDHKPPPQTCNSSTSLLNELNDFFARFEAHNTTPAQKSPTPLLVTNNIQQHTGELTDVFTVIFNISSSRLHIGPTARVMVSSPHNPHTSGQKRLVY